MTPSLVWFDGSIVPATEARVAPFTHALHYGSGVFEGIRAYAVAGGSAIFRLDEHLARLYRSADAYGLRIPYAPEALAAAIAETLRANAFDEGYIRPLVFFGERGISLAPKFSCPTHVLIALKPLTGSLVGDKPGARVTVSSWQKTPSRSLPATVKACGHYTNSILALHEAIERGCDDALLLTGDGHVAECTGENVFFVRDGVLTTNNADSDILPGITRASVLELATGLGIQARVRAFRLGELLEADEIFLTGTAAEIMPVAEIDGRTFAVPGPVTAVLQRAYQAAVRGEGRNARWVTHVSARRASA